MPAIVNVVVRRLAISLVMADIVNVVVRALCHESCNCCYGQCCL